MPPLLILAFATVIVTFLVSRLWMLRHKQETRELPFIADITHGICPKCGDEHPSSAVIKAEPASFWRQFNCHCGFAVRTHLKVD